MILHTTWCGFFNLRRTENAAPIINHIMMTSSNGKILLALCAGNSPVTGEFPLQRPVTRSFDVFFHLRLNSWVNNHTAGDLRRHCVHYDVNVMSYIFLRDVIDHPCRTLVCALLYFIQFLKSSMHYSLKHVPKDPTDNTPALVQIMAGCRLGDKPLSEPMMAWFGDALNLNELIETVHRNYFHWYTAQSVRLSLQHNNTWWKIKVYID